MFYNGHQYYKGYPILSRRSFFHVVQDKALGDSVGSGFLAYRRRYCRAVAQRKLIWVFVVAVVAAVAVGAAVVSVLTV